MSVSLVSVSLVSVSLVSVSFVIGVTVDKWEVIFVFATSHKE